MNKFKRLGSLCVGALITILIFAVTSFAAPAHEVLAAMHISVWWPVSGVTLASVQPFKALVDNLSTDKYNMYWQVDNGQLNPMDTNNTDAPHKEAAVDVTGWKWQSSGTYAVNFVAKDQQGNTIAESPVTIYANKADTASLPAPIQNPTPTTPVTPVQNSTVTITAPTTPVATAAPAPSPSIVVAAPVTSAPAPVVDPKIDIWWPTNGVTISATQPFKALAENTSLSDYDLYWQVDGGQLNIMSDNMTDYPHKQVDVDVSSWNWHGSGPYVLTFIAKNKSGQVIGQNSVSIYNNNHSSGNTTTNTTNPVTTTVISQPVTQPVVQPAVTQPTPVVQTQPAPVVQTQPAPTVQTSKTVSVAGDPLSGMTFYVDPYSNAANQARAWKTSNPTGAALMDKIAIEPAAKWLGDWNANIFVDTKAYVDAAASQDQVPVMIAYNIPQRDCGSYSAGGANSASAYQTWIKGLASGIGNRKAVVILEPDALSMIDCLSATDQATRYSLLNFAVNTLKANSSTIVYIDAGHSNWNSADVMSGRLNKAGITAADGFALNVSNFYATSDLTTFGQNLSALVNKKHFVIDTSRNGNGPLGSEWCNPSGRALGIRPTTSTGNSLIDGYLWLKSPGESDGTCNGGPSAGVWWPDYAVGLAQRAAY